MPESADRTAERALPLRPVPALLSANACDITTVDVWGVNAYPRGGPVTRPGLREAAERPRSRPRLDRLLGELTGRGRNCSAEHRRRVAHAIRPHAKNPPAPL
ncbi:hypothetical protein [Nocardiopsis sp. CNT312]|uniref:hypothetical protein n=1 Tax=Nocardiopsis sp. CNT312 TaxID=1137268 RepID=UPI00048DC9F1|nr:hypothetical protein [Nocardiopsis sp. CNT312]